MCERDLERKMSYNAVVSVTLSPYSMHLVLNKGKVWVKPIHSELFELLGKPTIKTIEMTFWLKKHSNFKK